MADSKRTFPMLPIGHWWSLRKKFRQSMPGIVTDNYIATVLEMQPNSARVNVLPYIKALGIIDQDGKITPRAKEWRDDEQYAKVCREMLKEVYPEELIQAVPDPAENRSQAERWFANHTGAGEAAVSRMTVLYTVISEADASKQPVEGRKDPKNGEKRTPKTQNPVRVPEPKESVSATKQKPASEEREPLRSPDLNINIQVHISADASADQIEQIFASMAKHLYRRS